LYRYPEAAEKRGLGGHLGFNWWFHAPDQFADVNAPYASALWEKDWANWLDGVKEGRE
jgi:hypothetical protein